MNNMQNVTTTSVDKTELRKNIEKIVYMYCEEPEIDGCMHHDYCEASAIIDCDELINDIMEAIEKA